MNKFLFAIKIHLIPVLLLLLLFSCNTSEGNETNFSLANNHKDFPLISANQLLGRIANNKDTVKNFVVIDMQPNEDYLKEHILGAINITREQINGEAINEDGTTSKKELEMLLGNSGIKNLDEIIIYDNKQNTEACRLWWLLKLFGHEKISILDGGLSYWKEKGHELTNKLTAIKPNEYHFAGKERRDIFASIDDLKKGLKDSNTVILDVRSLEEYDGSKVKDGAAYGGNIEGCEHLEFKAALNEGGSKNQCFKTEKELKALFKEKGISADKKIIVYCHSGTRSANTTFVLTQLLGYKNVSNYDGSWIEWSKENKK